MYIEKDRALERRFQIITIREPDVEDTIKMLKAKKKEYEDFHNVKIQEKVLELSLIHIFHTFTDIGQLQQQDAYQKQNQHTAVYSFT